MGLHTREHRHLDYDKAASAIFTEPEIADVGLAEADAFAEGRKLRVTKVPFSASAKALINNEPRGFVKILSDPATGVVLGGSIVGPPRRRADLGHRRGRHQQPPGQRHLREPHGPPVAGRGPGGSRRVSPAATGWAGPVRWRSGWAGEPGDSVMRDSVMIGRRRERAVVAGGGSAGPGGAAADGRGRPQAGRPLPHGGRPAGAGVALVAGLVRAGALVELVVGAAALVVGGPVAAGLVAASFVAFALFTIVAMRAGCPSGRAGASPRPTRRPAGATSSSTWGWRPGPWRRSPSATRRWPTTPCALVPAAAVAAAASNVLTARPEPGPATAPPAAAWRRRPDAGPDAAGRPPPVAARGARVTVVAGVLA